MLNFFPLNIQPNIEIIFDFCHSICKFPMKEELLLVFLVNGDWFWLILIGSDWCLLMLIDAYWFWLIWFILIDDDWYWLILVLEPYFVFRSDVYLSSQDKKREKWTATFCPDRVFMLKVYRPTQLICCGATCGALWWYFYCQRVNKMSSVIFSFGSFEVTAF